MVMQVGTQLRVKVKHIEIQDLKRKKARIGLGLIAVVGAGSLGLAPERGAVVGAGGASAFATAARKRPAPDTAPDAELRRYESGAAARKRPAPDTALMPLPAAAPSAGAAPVTAPVAAPRKKAKPKPKPEDVIELDSD